MSNSEPVQEMVETRARHQELAEFSLAQAARWIEKDLVWMSYIGQWINADDFMVEKVDYLK